MRSRIVRGGAAMRFAQRLGFLYAIVLNEPAGSEVVLNDLQPASETEIRFLGYGMPLRWHQRGGQLAVELPGDVPTGRGLHAALLPGTGMIRPLPSCPTR